MAHELEGRTVGNYVLRRLIDQGGVGLVFIAQHQFLDERAAMKILHTHNDSDFESSDLARRFFQEAKATRSVDHPNVVKILDFGKDPSDGLLYLVMELLEGESVADRLQRGPIPETQAAEIGRAVAGGLQAAHDQGIIHRDLKPGNIFLCKSGVAKLLDFGMAKLIKGNVQTAVGIVVGTPQYMAPEQVRPGEKVTNLTDVYGLGVVLFRMLTNRLPFIGNNLAELIRMHITEPPPHPSLYADISPQMERLVLACLEKDPHQRPSSMREVATRLKMIAELPPRVASGDRTMVDSVEAVASNEFDIEPTVPGGGPHEEMPEPSGRKTRPDMPAPPPQVTRPSSTKWIVGGVVLALGSIAAAWWILRSPPTLSAPPIPIAAPKPTTPTPPIAVLAIEQKAPPPIEQKTAPIVEQKPAPLAVPVVAEKPAPTVDAKTPPTAAPAPADPSGEQEVSIQSDPAGAQVFVHHDPRGVTPLTIKMALPQEIKLTLDGYKTLRKTVTVAGPILMKLHAAEAAPATPAAPAAPSE